MIQNCEDAAQAGNIEQASHAASRGRDEHQILGAGACFDEASAIPYEHAHRHRIHVENIPAIDNEAVVRFRFGKSVAQVIASSDVLISIEGYVQAAVC